MSTGDSAVAAHVTMSHTYIVLFMNMDHISSITRSPQMYAKSSAVQDVFGQYQASSAAANT